MIQLINQRLYSASLRSLLRGAPDHGGHKREETIFNSGETENTKLGTEGK